MFEESVIPSTVILQSVNDLTYFIILLQNNDPAERTNLLCINVSQELNGYKEGARSCCYWVTW